MHARELSERRGLQMDVQALALADESSAVGGEIQDLFLTDLPYSLVDGFHVVRYPWDVLYRTVVCDDHVLHVVVPETAVNQLTKEPRTDDLELSGQDTTGVDVAT